MASDAVIDFLKSSDRKMEYQTYDIKVERCRVDQAKAIVHFIPSREDSLERLLDENMQFVSSGDDTENIAIRNLMIEKLYLAMKKLNTHELALINALFFEGKSECDYGLDIKLSQQAVNKRKAKILKKLRHFIEI